MQNSLYTFQYPETSFHAFDSFQFHHRLLHTFIKFRPLRGSDQISPRINTGNTLLADTFDHEQPRFVIGDNKCSTGRWGRGEPRAEFIGRMIGVARRSGLTVVASSYENKTLLKKPLLDLTRRAREWKKKVSLRAKVV